MNSNRKYDRRWAEILKKDYKDRRREDINLTDETRRRLMEHDNNRRRQLKLIAEINEYNSEMYRRFFG